MLKLRQANLGDLMYVACGIESGEKEQMAAFSGAPFSIDGCVKEALNYVGPKWAIVDDTNEQVAVAVGGLTGCRPGVVRSWFMARPEAWAKGSNITALVAGVVAGTLQSSAHRVETVCLASREQARRWYEKVGLSYEATLKNYGASGEDAVLYVALRGPEQTGVTH